MPTPPFIVELRKKVGHELLWLPGVTAVVMDGDRRILLVRRADNGRWTLVTGCLDPGEQPAAGAVREVQEETGVEVVVERPLRVEALPASTYPNGDHVQFLDVAVLCRPSTSQAWVNDDESIDVGWFSADDLPELSSHARVCIEAALSDNSSTWVDTRG